MEENFDILSRLIKRKKPDVPENFFRSFSNDITRQVESSDESAEPAFEKTAKPEVPADFFKTFHANLKAEIETENVLADLNLVKRQKPEVPANFFADFKVELMSRIKPGPSRGRILKISFWSTAAAVAATLTLLFTLNTEEPASEIPVAETNTLSVDDESLDACVAYLDEESLVDYIIENDINVGENEAEDEIYDYVDSEIEDAYLDL
ncbi:MAG: hypothetical protein HYZ14_10700 [Bacteroidetes bacterium]|nr:hypothetical protein [Bacteroidota bacterium]